MASDPPESPPAADDTVLVDPPAAGGEQPTADGEWPVADLYYVEPDDAAAPHADDSATVVATAAAAEPTVRRFPPDLERGPVLALLALLAIAGGLILGALLLGAGGDDPEASRQPPTSPPATSSTTETSPAPTANAVVAVRDVEGLRLAQAREVLEKQGLRVTVTRSPSQRPPGEVLRQAPPAGAQVEKGTTVVALVVARETEPTPEQTTQVEVPGVIGMSASSAVSTLRDAGLEARVRLVASAEPSGTVVDQTPAEGADVADDTTIQLEVAKARPEVQRIAVPDVVGSTAEAARRQLRGAGLKVRTISVASQEPAGTVIAQSPGAGVELREGATVRLTVSTGPTKVDVPDVTGLDEASATQELERAGFHVRVIDESIADPAQDGVVLRQSPVGGSSAHDGAAVTITVGRLD